MPSDDKKYLPIKYLNREFTEIRADLLDMAERFYPDTFQDFSEASFGALMIDSVAYVADQLNFYLDYNVNPSFESSNIIRHGRALVYKNQGRPSTYGEVAIYMQVPADQYGIGPDTGYIPIMSRGSNFTSQNGLAFMLIENVDFGDPANPIVVSKVNASTGAPTHYAIKAYANVVSGRLGQKTFTIGDFERFRSISLSDPNIVEIVSIYDAEGNQYYEVDYLSQDMVFREVANKNYKNDNVASVLKPLLVSRKFTVEHTSNEVIIQFGSGDDSATNVVANPQNVAIDVFGKNYVTDTTFDPTRISKNRSYGIVPANTTLFVTYRTTNSNNSNVAAGTINKVNNAQLSFENPNVLSQTKIAELRESIEVSNEKPITGDVRNPSSAEIKRRIIDTFPTQNRAVTQNDYENVVYRMPSKYGSVKRVSVYKDQDSMKRNLNMYVISENESRKLVATNATIKNNIKTWLNNYRMINDTIDILDPYIINLGIDFVIRLAHGANSEEVLGNCITQLSQNYNETFFIGESFQSSDIYSILKSIQGVLDVSSVKITNKSGGQYSPTTFNVTKNTSPDGTRVLCPSNAIFEIKFPTSDIRGKIR